MKNTSQKFVLLLAPLVFTLSFAMQAQAGMRCSMVFIEQTQAVKNLVQYDAYAQWLKWETTANLEKYQKSTARFNMPTSQIAINRLNVQKDPTLPPEIAKLFLNQRSALWIKHPFNTEASVPFMNEPEGQPIHGYFTASRSVALTDQLRGFTIKTPTDHPHGANGEYQAGKAETADDVLSALLHSEHISAQDKKMGQDDVLMILPEVLTIADKTTGTGIVLRDVRQTDDGHYYLPALSIPYVGREIARINGQPFEAFWQKHYAQLLGEAKARLLLRYGLQMETPNPQNMLIQLDRNLKPTGKIAFRDVSDAFLVEGVAQSLGLTDAVQKDTAVGYEPKDTLQPYVSNSLWRLDEAGEKSVPTAVLNTWAKVHNVAFAKYVMDELGLNRPDLVKVTADDQLTALYTFLQTPAGRTALKAYAARKQQPPAMRNAG